MSADPAISQTTSRRRGSGLALRIGVACLAVLCLTYLPYLILGLWNRVFGGWSRVFFCYAGDTRFTRAYALPGITGFFRWRPSPIAVLRQNGSLGLVLAAPVTEAELLSPSNTDSQIALQRRIARIARLIGVRDVRAAGILPPLLADSPHLVIADSRPVVIDALRDAVAQLRVRHDLGADVILLGGAGHIGSVLAGVLSELGLRCHIVDPRAGSPASVPRSSAPPLLIDVSRAGAIEAQIDTLPPGTVILNEVFPAPRRAIRNRMRQAGLYPYHLAGVTGAIWPPLPFGYEGAVPCCAAEPDDIRTRAVLVAL